MNVERCEFILYWALAASGQGKRGKEKCESFHTLQDTDFFVYLVLQINAIEMKKPFLALLAASLLAACTGESGPGKAFNELPAVDADNIWAFFKAIPAADLPEDLSSPQVREAYRPVYEGLLQGVLGDGEGPEETVNSTANSIFWSDYFANPEQDPIPGKKHPYVNLHVYSNVGGDKLFGVMESGAYTEGDPIEYPQKAWWFTPASGKIAPAKVEMDPKYTEDELTSDALLLFGSDNLFYAVKNGKYGPNYYDSGLNIYIEDVGMTGVIYDWNGVKFVRHKNPHIPAIFNYGFSHITLGDDVPFSVPGYITDEISHNNPFDQIFRLAKEGADEPELIFHASDDMTIFQIDVYPERYCNPWGIYPGMSVADFMTAVQAINSRFPEPTYTNVVENQDGYVDIYTGFDEDFIYKVLREDWLGGDSFSPSARLACVCVAGGVG